MASVHPVGVDARAPRRGTGWRALGWLSLTLLGAVAGLVLSQPWWLGPVLSRYLSATSGRAVHFDSAALLLSESLALRLRLRGVRIENAPWSRSGRPLAAVEEAEFHLSGRRSEGRWIVSRMRIRDGEVNLERTADGMRNWRLRDPDHRGHGRFWFTVLEAERTALSFAHAGIDLMLKTTASPAAAAASAADAALPSRIDFEGTHRGIAFAGSTLAGPAISLLKSGAWFAVRGHAEIEGVRAEIDGRVADLVREPHVEGRVTLAATTLAAMAPWIGDRYPTPKALRVSGQLALGPGRMTFTTAQAKVGATDFAGQLAWSREAQTHRLRAGLKSDSADLVDLAWLAGRSAPPAGRAVSTVAPATVAASGAAAAAGRAEASTSTSTSTRASAWDAELSFDAKRLRVAQAKAVQSLALKAKLLDGRLDVDPFDAGVAGGRATGSFRADLRQPTPRVETQLAWRGVRVESLLGDQDADRRISGTLQGRGTLKASGDGLDELIASAIGDASMRIADGAIASMLDAKIGLQGGKVVRTLLSGNEPLPLPCAAATVHIAAGKARITSLVIDSANTRTTGTGTVHLGPRTIDLVLTPTSKKPGLFDLGKSIRLQGRLDKPARELVERVGQDHGGGAC